MINNTSRRIIAALLTLGICFDLYAYHSGLSTDENVIRNCMGYSHSVYNLDGDMDAIRTRDMRSNRVCKIYNEGGRKIVALRGSATENDWIANVKIEYMQSPGGGMTHRGFLSRAGEIYPRIFSRLQGWEGEVIFTGHSLGGALAITLANMYTFRAGIENNSVSNVVKVFAFSPPKVGDEAFRDSVNARVGVENILSFGDKYDPVVHSPPYYERPGIFYYYSNVAAQARSVTSLIGNLVTLLRPSRNNPNFPIANAKAVHEMPDDFDRAISPLLADRVLDLSNARCNRDVFVGDGLEQMPEIREQMRNNFLAHDFGALLIDTRHNLLSEKVRIEEKYGLSYRLKQLETVTILFGDTRSGKSTVFDFLQRKEMHVMHTAVETVLTSDKENFDQAAIGRADPGTVVPDIERLEYKDRNSTDSFADIIDMPGFSDNRGFDAELLNQYFYNQALIDRRINMLYVVDYADLSDANGANFVPYLQKMLGMFGSQNIGWFDSIHFIINKVNIGVDGASELLGRSIMPGGFFDNTDRPEAQLWSTVVRNGRYSIIPRATENQGISRQNIELSLTRLGYDPDDYIETLYYSLSNGGDKDSIYNDLEEEVPLDHIDDIMKSAKSKLFDYSSYLQDIVLGIQLPTTRFSRIGHMFTPRTRETLEGMFGNHIRSAFKNVIDEKGGFVGEHKTVFELINFVRSFDASKEIQDIEGGELSLIVRSLYKDSLIRENNACLDYWSDKKQEVICRIEDGFKSEISSEILKLLKGFHSATKLLNKEKRKGLLIALDKIEDILNKAFDPAAEIAIDCRGDDEQRSIDLARRINNVLRFITEEDSIRINIETYKKEIFEKINSQIAGIKALSKKASAIEKEIAEFEVGVNLSIGQLSEYTDDYIDENFTGHKTKLKELKKEFNDFLDDQKRKNKTLRKRNDEEVNAERVKPSGIDWQGIWENKIKPGLIIARDVAIFIIDIIRAVRGG